MLPPKLPPLRSRRMVPKTIRRLLLVIGVLYLAPLGVLCAFQRALIFHATASPVSVKTPLGAEKVTFFTGAGDRITAYYGPALRANGRPDPNYARRPTLLFFYGKGCTLDNCRVWFQTFRRLDVNVLMPDYAGFGQSAGQASETNCYLTAEAACRWLRAQTKLQHSALVIAGYSLGSGVAVHLAAKEEARHEPVAGLALFAAYTSMAAEAHERFSIYPTWLLRLAVWNRFDSEAVLPTVHCPVLLVHSRDDSLIPYEMSDRLAAVCRGKVTRLTITQADHADYFRAGGKTVFAALGQFLENAQFTHETQSHSKPYPAAHRLRSPRPLSQKASADLANP